MGAKKDVDSINNVIKTIGKTLSDVSAFAPFISVKIGDLMISTSNVDSKSNYLMSLTLEKNGSGKANNFTIAIAYVPNVTTSDVNNDFDNLDISLIGSKCEFYYGYTFPYTYDMQVSPKYEGVILDYNIEINQGMVNYTITGYSNLCSLKDVKISKTSAELYALAKNTYNPIKLIKGLLEEQIKAQKLNYEVEDTVNAEGGCGCWDNENLFEAVTDVSLFEYINSVILPSVRSKNPDQKDVSVTSEENVEETNDDGNGGTTDDEYTQPTDLVTFTFNVHDYVDDASTNKCKITLDYNNPKESLPCIDLDFSWMTGKLTDIVLNFSPQFSGSVALACASSLKSKLLESKNENGSVAISGEGVMEVIESYIGSKLPANTGDSSYSDIVSAIATMAIFQQAPYTASLTTLGIPVDIPILTHMSIKPLIYGKPHYTAGEYYITKQTDSIGAQGFTSAFELMRIQKSTDLSEIDKIIKKLTN